MNILFVSGESNPFAKTGGLADVCFSLAKEMVRGGEKVTVCIPYYQHLKNSRLTLKEVASFEVKMNWRTHSVTVYETSASGVRFFFVACDTYFDRPNMYSYDDDVERFALFDMAVIELLRRRRFSFDVVHVHDWQAGMVPLLLRRAGLKAKTVLTIHNPAFQGNFSPDYLTDYLNLPRSLYDDGTVRFNDYCSFLKTGLVTADAVTTVSVTHAEELRADKCSFNGLGNIIELIGPRFLGITNGIDADEFNPATDALIERNYDLYSYREGKAANLLALEKEFAYKRVPKGPVYGVVTRLTSQKGIESIVEIAPALVTYDMQLIVVGSGERELENQIAKLTERYPDHVKFFLGYSNPLAHMVYAASDFFLMPSRFEPCGTGQLIAMRYGALPIVTKVGGLNDTVVGYADDPLRATGFSYGLGDDKGLIDIIKQTHELYRSDALKPLIANAMNYDSSWNGSVRRYLDLYRSL